MKRTNQTPYESPKAEIIVIERQGVLCASGGGSTIPGTTGNGGVHFGTSDGQW